MQAIQTKYHGPTNTTDGRVSATATAGRVYSSWDYEADNQENHRVAAMALVHEMGWDNQGRSSVKGVKGGQLKDGTYVWILEVSK